jgi:molybdate transport system substrate-binding protein
MSKALLAATLIPVVLLMGCSNSDGEREELLVFAATSLTDAFDEAVALYERENDVDVQTSYAASQVLAQQIASGAPASVFVSAARLRSRSCGRAGWWPKRSTC